VLVSDPVWVCNVACPGHRLRDGRRFRKFKTGNPARRRGGRGAPGKKSAGGLSGPVEVPIIAHKPTDRQISEEEKADYEKAVADYIKAKKAGSIPGEDCSKVASAFRKLADQVPALLEARSNEAAVDLECGKKGDAVGIWKKLAAAAKPFAPALANLGYVSWQEGNKSDAESLFKRSIEADPGAALSPLASIWPKSTVNGLASRAALRRSRSTTRR